MSRKVRVKTAKTFGETTPDKKPKQRRTVSLCNHTSPAKGKGNSPRLWAFSLKDLAELYGVAEDTVRIWVKGRKRASEGKKSIPATLNPSSLGAICDLREDRRWIECGSPSNPSDLAKYRAVLGVVCSYLHNNKPEYAPYLERAIFDVTRALQEDLDKGPSKRTTSSPSLVVKCPKCWTYATPSGRCDCAPSVAS